MDMEEHCRDLEKELERWKRKCHDMERDMAMDDEEDEGKVLYININFNSRAYEIEES